jgi:methyltransferase domain protein
MERKTNYGNWIPITILRICYGVSALLILLFLFFLCCWPCLWAEIITGILAVISPVVSVFMHYCRYIFSFNGGGLMGEIHQFLIDHLEWKGDGTLLDIGCGAAALTNRCAKHYPKAALTGIDYWGIGWNYAKEQCEKNAGIEGVADRVTFQKGDAAKLDFEDETFDAAVSNFVFHEVRSQSDKREVVREALRVIKKGGSFAFQDLFGSRSLYGDMAQFIEILHNEGISEIHYIPHVERQPFISRRPALSLMLRNMGLLYGRK